MDLRSGNYDLAKGIVAPDVRVRANLMDGSDGSLIKGPTGIASQPASGCSAKPSRGNAHI